MMNTAEEMMGKNNTDMNRQNTADGNNIPGTGKETVAQTWDDILGSNPYVHKCEKRCGVKRKCKKGALSPICPTDFSEQVRH